MNNCVVIAATEAEAAARKETGVEPKLKAAMQAVKNHWLVTNPDDRLQAAVAGAYTTMEEEDKERTIKTWRVLQSLCGASEGIPVEFDKLDRDFEAVPILPLWKEVTEGK